MKPHLNRAPQATPADRPDTRGHVGSMWAALLEQSSEAIVITDTQRRLVLANGVYTQTTGHALAEMCGKVPSIAAFASHTARFRRMIWAEVDRAGSWHGEVWDTRSNGERYPARLSIAAVMRDDEVTHYSFVFSDLTAHRQAEEQLQFVAHHDALTELPNRAALTKCLQTTLRIATAEANKVGLLLLDLDGFKHINDSLGHDLGDKLLRAVAGRLRNSVRNSDTVCRQGGDEFLVILPDIGGREPAARVARKLCSVLGAPYRIEGHKLTSTSSIGISIFPDDGADMEALIRHADTALHEAKHYGPNSCQSFDLEMSARAHRRLAVETGLRQALERGDFELHYQPQVSSTTGRTIGLEALIRWRRDNAGLTQPGEFIAVAEESGLIGRIGEWVLNAACRQQRKWRRRGFAPPPIAINISPLQFRESGFESTVAGILAEHQVPPGSLEFELTESAVMKDSDAAIATLTALKELGVQVSIDDFGTGYSSLSHLTRFPIDRLKIDRSFVRAVDIQPAKRVVLRSVIGLGAALGVDVLAEGVETAGELRILREERCPAMQGYYFSRPLPAADLEHWVSASVRGENAAQVTGKVRRHCQ